jgi:hypothetical protein
VIDTNVFEHLLYDEKNLVLGDLDTKTEEKHINKLLKFLQRQGYKLCMDKQKRIKEEYKYRLGQRIKNSSDERDEILILRYWILLHDPHFIDTEINLSLDKILKTIILNDDDKPETTDCIFVHIAAMNRCNLVTNDSDYTLAEDPSSRNKNKKKTSQTSKSKIKGNDSYKKRQQIRLSRMERVKKAIKKHLNHEETDILTSVQAHQVYIYPVGKNSD